MLGLLLPLLVGAFGPPPYAPLLLEWSGNLGHAVAVANAVEHYSTERELDPTLVLGVVWVENRELKPRATARDGSVGIMQVQPLWLESFGRACGHDLRTIDTNICVGTAVLAWAIASTTSLPAALWKYNGCTRRRCRAYATRVLTKREELQHGNNPEPDERR